MDKIFCKDCKHCVIYKAKIELSQCSRFFDAPDPVTGKQAMRYCKLVNAKYDCGSFEAAKDDN